MRKSYDNINNKFPTKDITPDDISNKIKLVSDKKRKKNIKIKNNLGFSNKSIPLICGPNGLESLKLGLSFAKFINKLNLNFMRVHIFKPLTFPYRSRQYSEAGINGIEWIKEIRKQFPSMILICEITELQHLEILSKNVDILQIGTRNMQNFELLRECSKSKMPLILKRHFGSSIRDLLGAAEHILLDGNDKLILCERGIVAPHTHRDTSRYMLDIQSIPAIKEITNLPIISDPSHASFWAPWVTPLAKASIAAGADGLIIESHPEPSKSKVDPLQPLNYNEFKKLLISLKKIAKADNRQII